MLNHLLVIATCTAALAGPIAAQAPDTTRPRIVVDAFSFSAPVESHHRKAPPERPPLFGGGMRSPARAPFPTAGPWHRHSSAPGGLPSRASQPRAAAFAHDKAAAASADARATDDALQQLGQGIADLLVDQLLQGGQYRILERQRLDAVLRERTVATGQEPTPAQRAAIVGARYYVTGTITRFGTEDRNFLGGGGMRGVLGILGVQRRRTEVALVARVVDTQTGEVVASVRSLGSSGKGSGVTLGGLGGGMGGLGNVGSSEFRSSALGEATERAVAELAGELGLLAAQLAGG